MIGGCWIAIAGDVHGDLARLDRLLGRFERAAEARVSLVLQVGDLELPDDARPLRAEVVFVSGNHDPGETVREGYTSLGPAGVVEREGVRIGGLSGIFHPGISQGSSRTASPEYCKPEHVALLLRERLDILLLHEWPEGLKEGARGNPHGRLLVDRLAPRWVFCGHRHAAFAGELGASRVRCLGDVPRGGEDAVSFLRLPDLVEAAPLGELETFKAMGRGGAR